MSDLERGWERQINELRTQLADLRAEYEHAIHDADIQRRRGDSFRDLVREDTIEIERLREELRSR